MSLTRASLDELIDVPRALWDPTEGTHPRHGERTLASVYGVEVHWVGTGNPADDVDDTGQHVQMTLELIERHNLPIKVVLGLWLRAEVSNHEGRCLFSES